VAIDRTTNPVHARPGVRARLSRGGSGREVPSVPRFVGQPMGPAVGPRRDGSDHGGGSGVDGLRAHPGPQYRGLALDLDIA